MDIYRQVAARLDDYRQQLEPDDGSRPELSTDWTAGAAVVLGILSSVCSAAHDMPGRYELRNNK